MDEWVLILALNIASGTPGELRDMSLPTVAGFSSQATCNAAGQAISGRAVALVGLARMQTGLQGNGNRSTAVLNFECVFLKK